MKKQLCSLLCISGLLTLSGCNWFEKKETKSEPVTTQMEPGEGNPEVEAGSSTEKPMTQEEQEAREQDLL